VNAPIVTIFVRHLPGCKYARYEFYRRCNCRKHLRWSLDGKQHRKTAGTRSWEHAEQEKSKLEVQLSGEPVPVTIAEALELFKAHKRSQGLTPNALGKYTRELARLKSWAEEQWVFTEDGRVKRGVLTLAGLTRERLIAYQATWPEIYTSTQTRRMVRARLTNFLRFCFDNKWLHRMPETSRIKVQRAQKPRPLTPKQYEHLLKTIPKTFSAPAKAARVRGITQLMRWSGLGITDAACLRSDELLYSGRKTYHVTRRPVNVPIPLAVAEEILAGANKGAAHLFWSGNGKSQSFVTNVQHDFRKLFKNAGIKAAGHMLSHRLRDTFAADLLQKDVPLLVVSDLLGHESIQRITERRYAKWVTWRQDRFDKSVMRSWD
jgi:integrase/recombinase XerD